VNLPGLSGSRSRHLSFELKNLYSQSSRHQYQANPARPSCCLPVDLETNPENLTFQARNEDIFPGTLHLQPFSFMQDLVSSLSPFL
jgi:hypothetical protein